jgi:hypothetical protein
MQTVDNVDLWCPAKGMMKCSSQVVFPRPTLSQINMLLKVPLAYIFYVPSVAERLETKRFSLVATYGILKNALLLNYDMHSIVPNKFRWKHLQLFITIPTQLCILAAQHSETHLIEINNVLFKVQREHTYETDE